MSEETSAYQNGVAFGRIDRLGGRSTEMSAQTVGLYPGKYIVQIPTVKELVEANIFTNCFSAKGGQYSSKDFRWRAGSTDFLLIGGAYW